MSGSKIVTDNLIKWDDSSNNALAPLTINQKEWLVSLEEQISSSETVNFDKSLEESSSEKKCDLIGAVERIETYQELLKCYTGLEER